MKRDVPPWSNICAISVLYHYDPMIFRRNRVYQCVWNAWLPWETCFQDKWISQAVSTQTKTDTTVDKFRKTKFFRRCRGLSLGAASIKKLLFSVWAEKMLPEVIEHSEHDGTIGLLWFLFLFKIHKGTKVEKTIFFLIVQLHCREETTTNQAYQSM